LLCLKEQLALFIKLKRDISPIFPDIRLAGEIFQKTRQVPAYLHPSAVKRWSRILIFPSIPLLQTIPGKSFSIHSSVRKWLALPP
jgi:hypothetical protein